MNCWKFVILTLLVVLPQLSVAEVADEDYESLTIPLDQIVGPGYRALRALEPELCINRDTPEKWGKYSTPDGIKEAEKLAAQSLALPIERAMGKMRPAKDGMPDRGFAVEGEGRAALQGIYDVLVKGEQPQLRFEARLPVSVIFYAVPSTPLRIESVTRQQNEISIRYALAPQAATHLRWHLSIIPLGNLPTGKYEVTLSRSTDKEKALTPNGLNPLPSNAEDAIVCRPFSFEVVELRKRARASHIFTIVDRGGSVREGPS